MRAEVMVVGEYPVNFGSREIEGAPERGDDLGRDEACFVLYGVQHRNQRCARREVPADDLVRGRDAGVFQSGAPL